MGSLSSKVDICNMGLGHVGDSTISSIDESTKAARKCKLYYDLARDKTLELMDWPHARKRVELAQDPTAPANEYAYRYALPSDLIAMRREASATVQTQPTYLIEDGYLVTDEAEAHIVYTYRNEDEGSWPPSFVDAMAAILGSYLATSLAGDQRLAAQLLALGEALTTRAGANSGNQENPPEMWGDNTSWQTAGRG